MKNDGGEKRALEKAALKTFLSLYNRNHPIKYRLLYFQEKPDAVIQDARGNKLGVEITHCFYDSHEARRVLGRQHKVREEEEHAWETLDTLIAELNKLIRRKEEKKAHYVDHYPIALLIRNASLSFGMSDILKYREMLCKPGGAFTHVWFLSRDGTKDWLLTDLCEPKQAEPAGSADDSQTTGS
ncbi:hypothetical protein MJA45_04945 [Paenibacillus aurantius]|uniref:Uncharacterized protein n=1 Tax=Paenibacillus aurantius TaxID=2918900 RepID=A0AA96LE63_9BACL|nr:hypothetical protein [Paenibacillus aurantius]WNQ12399.1 hypothetical protein MJA45_04945 [Paenibacillus aurantius]